MKKFLLRLGGFGLFAGLLFPLLLFAWGQYFTPPNKPNLSYVAGGIGNLHNRLQEAKTTGPVDILFLGSSHAYRGFDVRIFRRQGYSAFNLGSSSQTPLQTRILLRRYLQKLQPKLVVYALDPSVFSVDGVESAIDLTTNDGKDWSSLSMALRLSNIRLYNTLVYSFFMDRVNTPDSFRKKDNMQLDTYVAGGFVEREISFFNPEQHPPVEWPQRAYQLRAFKATMQQIKKSGACCLLVFPPITTGLYNSYRGVDVFDKQMRGYAPYYNFNGRLQLTDSLHFYDAEHLNQNGVLLFNAALLEKLKELHLLKSGSNSK